MAILKTKADIYRYTGDGSQLFGIKDYILQGGKAAGARAIDINSGAGLQFTVCTDRAMDISYCSYKGINLSYISKSGTVCSKYCDNHGQDTNRAFTAGLFTTCGFDNVGGSVVEDGEAYPLHGRISAMPAEEVCASTLWEDDGAELNISGKIRHERFFGQNMVLSRRIRCRYGSKTIQIDDTIENLGHTAQPFMLLYHTNFGYPLLDEGSEFLAPVGGVQAFNDAARKAADSFRHYLSPQHGWAEQIFYHDLKADAEGHTFAGLVNRKLELGVVIHFNKRELDRLIQWKQTGEGEYVAGIEPANCGVAGRVEERKAGTLKYIAPGETKHVHLKFEVLEGLSEIGQLEQKAKSL